MNALRDRFLRAILEGDLAAALSVAEDARVHGLPAFYEMVVTPALVEIGRLWERGTISVADEHVATAVAQSVLASRYPMFPWTTSGPKAIVACVSGERHELGARMAADLFSWDGWDVMYVGADVPLDALVARVEREAPVFVGLSVGLADRLPVIREAIARLRRARPGLKLLVGGRAVASAPAGLDVGADEIARSASSAVASISRWKP